MSEKEGIEVAIKRAIESSLALEKTRIMNFNKKSSNSSDDEDLILELGYPQGWSKTAEDIKKKIEEEKKRKKKKERDRYR